MGFSLIAATALLSITLLMICSIAIDKLEPTLQNIQTAQKTMLQRRVDQLNTDIKLLNVTKNWWNVSWDYRKLITINASQVQGDHVNFPVLISLASDSDLANDSKCQNDGDDIVFVLYSDNTVLNHEIEEFDGSTGKLNSWVNVTNLDGTSDTLVWMYYGNPTCSSQQNKEGTWDSNYVLVLHLNETTGTHYDSTSYSNDGTPAGNPDQNAIGIIDGADDFDGTNEGVDIPSTSGDELSNFSSLTLEAWIEPDQFKSDGTIVGKPHNVQFTNPYVAYYLTLGENDNLRIQVANGSTRYFADSTSNSFQTDTWYYCVGTWDGSNLQCYINGSANGSSASFSNSINQNDEPVPIAEYTRGPPGGYDFNGIIDEIRISNIDRSENWIQTCFNTMNDSSTFFSIDSEETKQDGQVSRLEILNQGNTAIIIEELSIIIDGVIYTVTSQNNYILPSATEICFTDQEVVEGDRLKLVTGNGIITYYVHIGE